MLLGWREDFEPEDLMPKKLVGGVVFIVVRRVISTGAFGSPVGRDTSLTLVRVLWTDLLLSFGGEAREGCFEVLEEATGSRAEAFEGWMDAGPAGGPRFDALEVG